MPGGGPEANPQAFKADARGKTADAGDDIAREYWLLVVKAQPVAQCQSPDQPILLDLMSLDHLRLGRPARIDAVERVEDEIGVIARRPKGGDDRVEHSQIYGGHKDQLVSSSARPIRGAARTVRLAPAALKKGLVCAFNPPCPPSLFRSADQASAAEGHDKSENSQLIERALALIRPDVHQILGAHCVLSGPERHPVLLAERAVFLFYGFSLLL